MSKWKLDNLEDQNDKVFIITGANSGIGYTATTELVKKGATVVMAVRNLSKGDDAKAAILETFPKAKIETLQLDLADFESINKFCSDFQSKYERLDVLINNAGIMMPNKRMVSSQGFEIQLATNHLGHFILTKNLLPILESTPNARVVTVSSIVTKMKSAQIYFKDLQFEKTYAKMASYAQSKLANIMFALDLDERLSKANSNVISVAAHPGYTSTNLQQHMGLLGTVMNTLMAQKQEMGVLPILRAATSTEVKGGDYYGPTKMGEYRGYPERVSAPEIALDKSTRRKLWVETERLTQTLFKIEY